MKVLIIEDEREAARCLAEDLKKLRPQIEIVGTTSGIEESVRTINATQDLDIVFADVKIDDGMSFRVFEQVHTDAMIVFTTAYDRFALSAFDYNCADYLLKPVSTESLERALARCEKRNIVLSPDILRRMSAEIISGNIGFRKRLLIEKGADLIVRDVEDLCYVLTEGGYVTVFFNDGSSHMFSNPLTSLSESLDPAKFMRISRQVLVNLGCVDRISHGEGRNYLVKLKPPYTSKSFVITADTKRRILLHLE